MIPTIRSLLLVLATSSTWLLPGVVMAGEAYVNPTAVTLGSRAVLIGEGALLTGTITCDTEGPVSGMEIVVEQRTSGGTVVGFVTLTGGNVLFEGGTETCATGENEFSIGLENQSELSFHPGMAVVTYCIVGDVDCGTGQRLLLVRKLPARTALVVRRLA